MKGLKHTRAHTTPQRGLLGMSPIVVCLHMYSNTYRSTLLHISVALDYRARLLLRLISAKSRSSSHFHLTPYHNTKFEHA